MIIAVHLRTESGDSYLFLEEVSNEAEMLEEIELACVYDYDIEVIGGSADIMRDCLQERIVDLQIGEE